ncbi:MAG: SRPBCC family protein [Hyphomonadaceae bacterium]|nr:SRPBCC family protein [Hyphomonadaceae bacterium]
MRWFLGLLLVIALVTGALYGVGTLLLPNTLEVTRSIEIDRPRATVFAMANDLRIVKEWSPYYARDPDAEYQFSGEGPGAGQTMRWQSDVRDVGSGRMSIVASEQNQFVETILELGDRATLNTRLNVARQPENKTNVSWSVSAACAEGYINVPCRYMNLIMRQMVERDLDAGLARLKTLAEQLPDIDFETLQSTIEPIEPQTYVYAQVTAPTNNPPEAEQASSAARTQVENFMANNSMVRAGDLIRVATEWDANAQRTSFRIGYPFSGPTPLTVVGVQIGQTPSGEAIHVTHRGPRAAIPNTYAKIYAYLQAHRIEMREGGLPWEVVRAEGTTDGAVPADIEIYVPLQ